jgi:hypothetical protein
VEIDKSFSRKNALVKERAKANWTYLVTLYCLICASKALASALFLK